ncbi:arginase [Jannaschia seohaensis]|uniref:Arginase n=1 Tax=Jannaschia seohaensis TaxID=475081 RepID=A0A2Y9A1E0_9RHOB|nr:arginase [Jannaschia seohaensis]PWJ21936.1 arginase [Jannaschia seohaensis]SSA38214.1 arginase [Jannaschia seohaensis]
MHRQIDLIGVPVQCGAGRRGCVMGPDALRTAGLDRALTALGHDVRDLGNLAARPRDAIHRNPAIHDLSEAAGWVDTIQRAEIAPDRFPIFLGGDHLMAAGTVPAMAARTDRPLFVLWLDAHSDIHTLDSSESGNLHGTPISYVTGRADFTPHFPAPAATVDPKNVCMIGLRSVDGYEKQALAEAGIDTADMRHIDEHGIAAPLRAFLDRVRDADGALHVSFDVDFLDPAIAPAVGTTVPGGATFREAHLAMELLAESGLVTSLDLAELNPFLDDRGRTATLLVDLVSSLFGKTVLDRPTRSRL